MDSLQALCASGPVPITYCPVSAASHTPAAASIDRPRKKRRKQLTPARTVTFAPLVATVTPAAPARAPAAGRRDGAASARAAEGEVAVCTPAVVVRSPAAGDGDFGFGCGAAAAAAPESPLAPYAPGAAAEEEEETWVWRSSTPWEGSPV
jgi:hypothetical protein